MGVEDLNQLGLKRIQDRRSYHRHVPIMPSNVAPLLCHKSIYLLAPS